jgi:glycosyltransferase involved in cell wall biosynthesis
VPVVASNVGGLPEVVRDGVTGSLRAPGDVEAMAAAAVEMLGDTVRWTALSTAAAADARSRFALTDVVAQYESLYARAIS